MKILIVATKTPWPTNDGGRLALWLTMQGLAKLGHELRLIAPLANRSMHGFGGAESVRHLERICAPTLVPVRKRSWLEAIPRALAFSRALTLVRHDYPEVESAAAECIAQWQPDVVHVEQIQALAHAQAAKHTSIPVVLRMHNVESDLWQQSGRSSWRLRALLFEAQRLRRDEIRAMRDVAKVVTLTRCDAEKLGQALDAAQRISILPIPPPFPSELPSAEAIEGNPAIVLSGSAGWLPNRDALRWFLETVAVPCAREIPASRIHVFGGQIARSAQVRFHPAPQDSITAHPVNAIVAIPLRIASGIRMRILEAFARGLPVISSTVAARGLAVHAGRELLIADSPHEFIEAIRQLANDEALRARLIQAGRLYLREHHDCEIVTAALVRCYDRSIHDSRAR